GRIVGVCQANQAPCARRRRKRDERLRPTQRAVSPAGDGASFSSGSRRRLLALARLTGCTSNPRDTICLMSSTEEGLSVQDAAKRAGVTPATLRRWAQS